MKKKILSIVLAGAMASSLVATSALSASALEPGGYDSLGTYTPSANVKNTNHLMFAMPGAWLNDTTANEKVNNAAGIYWWNGYDTCPDTAKKQNKHEWPGYMATKVEEDGVENLWAIDVPTYGNGEEGNAMTILWNNSLNGGTETDPALNPFFDAAQQTKNIKAQYYCKNDEHKYYDILFRYVYKNAMVKEEVDGAADLDIASATFWEDINKLACSELGEKTWDQLKDDEKTYQIDLFIDDIELDFSEFGKYATNFFNEDLVGDEIYPAEVTNEDCISFHYDNMVFVVDFDPNEMQISDVSPKVGFGGDWFFYYGNGDYGTWPTKELNDQMAETFKDNKDITVVSGNFMSDEYWKSSMEDISVPSVPVATTVPAPATDATSSASGSTSGTSANNSNGAIATGQVSFAVIAFVILIAGVGVVYFTRRKRED